MFKQQLLYSLVISIIILLHLSFFSAQAQRVPKLPTFSIEGSVTSDEQPVPFATVSINSTTIGTAASADGKYNLTQVPAGKQVVRVQGLGQKPFE